MQSQFSQTTKSLEEARFLSPILNETINRAKKVANKKDFIDQVIGQYYGLVIEVPHYLSEMAIIANSQGWKNIERELIRNRAEEYGSRTNGIPHRSLFSRSLRNELQIEVESFERNRVTHNFLCSIMGSLLQRKPQYALGVMYALEDTATPELLIVGELISQIHPEVSVARLSNNELAAKDRGTHASALSLEAFLRMHVVDFEIGHREGLRTAITKDLGDTLRSDFLKGYLSVIQSMEDWWWYLAAVCE